jgi:S-adenosylmethionine hydrolase
MGLNRMPSAAAQALTLAFLTDYGWNDAYRGILHAVALSRLNPQGRACVTCMDITHGITPQCIDEASWALIQVLSYLPAHSVVVSIVDPYVGEADQQLLLVARSSYEQCFIAPDNGLLQPLLPYLPDAQVFRLPLSVARDYGWLYATPEAEASAGQTFHGRDIYTPFACHLLNAWSAGTEFVESLEPFDPYTCSAEAQASLNSSSSFMGYVPLSGTGFQASVRHVDRFGNCITTLPHHLIAATYKALRVYHNATEYTLPLVDSYAAGQHSASHVFAVRGSHGFLELASFGGPCALALHTADVLEVYLFS